MKFKLVKTYDQSAVLCSKQLMKTLIKSFKINNQTVFKLPSGATHDASAMSDLCNVAMLFIRSKNGLSHNPKEFTAEKDMQEAIKILETAIINIT